MTGIVTFSGFTEDYRASTGTDDLHARVLVPFEGPGVKVYDLRFWDADTRGLAAKVARDGCSKAIVVGYSWGAGYASLRFMRAAQKQGVEVVLACLCDPVYRPLWLPTMLPANVLGFRALVPKSARIEIPKGVGRVAAVRQSVSIPQGHPLKTSPPTSVVDIKLHGYSHTAIDSAGEWFALVNREITQALN